MKHRSRKKARTPSMSLRGSHPTFSVAFWNTLKRLVWR